MESSKNVLVAARTEDAKTGSLRPVLFVVPTDAVGLEASKIEMDLMLPENQWSLFFDDIRLPAGASLGQEDAAIFQLFAGLNPKRMVASAIAIGQARFALEKAADYAKERTVWGGKPIGTHQGIAHPLAQSYIEVEFAKLMMQKAAVLYDDGDDTGAGVAANMAKYAAGEAAVLAVDPAIQTHGGNGLSADYGLAAMSATPASHASHRSAAKWSSTSSHNTTSAYQDRTDGVGYRFLGSVRPPTRQRHPHLKQLGRR